MSYVIVCLHFGYPVVMLDALDRPFTSLWDAEFRLEWHMNPMGHEHIILRVERGP